MLQLLLHITYNYVRIWIYFTIWQIDRDNVEHFKSVRQKTVDPGANPTTVSYNASAVKNYNATSSLVRLPLEKDLACIVVVNLEIVGLAPGFNVRTQSYDF
jgi:hypothetical protein